MLHFIRDKVYILEAVSYCVLLLRTFLCTQVRSSCASRKRSSSFNDDC
jgi:hypothetical protein